MSELFTIKKSPIQGKGVFAKQTIKRNQKIGVAIIYRMFMIPEITSHFGKWLNHSSRPNTRLVRRGKEYQIVANRMIKKNEEITVNYDRTPWFIDGAQPEYV